MTFAWGVFFAPFLAVLLIWLLARPLSRWIWRALPNGRLRRFLFKRLT